MAITASGFDGSVNETQFAKMMTGAGVSRSVAGTADYAATAVTGARAVTVDPGSAYAFGVIAESDAATVLNMAAPTAGQWHLLVLKRDWTNNTIVLALIPGETTSESTPTFAPATLPALEGTPGVRDDQKLFWLWVNSATTGVKIIDVRDLTSDQRFARASLSIPSEVGRNLRFPNPVQGNRNYRADFGYTEAYFEVHHATTNPGGTTPAGWYPVSGNVPTCILTSTSKAMPNNLERNIGGTTDYAPPWVKESDPHSWFPGGSDVRPTVAGRYSYSLATAWDPNTVGSRLARLKRNDSGGVQSGSMTGVLTPYDVQGTGHGVIAIESFPFNGTSDYLRCSAYQNSGAGLAMSARLVIRYVGPPVGPAAT